MTMTEEKTAEVVGLVALTDQHITGGTVVLDGVPLGLYTFCTFERTRFHFLRDFGQAFRACRFIQCHFTGPDQYWNPGTENFPGCIFEDCGTRKVTGLNFITEAPDRGAPEIGEG